MVNFTPLAHYPQETDPGTHCTGGWVDSKAGLDATEKRKIMKELQ
jgi:hypothetical protein